MYRVKGSATHDIKSASFLQQPSTCCELVSIPPTLSNDLTMLFSSLLLVFLLGTFAAAAPTGGPSTSGPSTGDLDPPTSGPLTSGPLTRVTPTTGGHLTQPSNQRYSLLSEVDILDILCHRTYKRSGQGQVSEYS